MVVSTMPGPFAPALAGWGDTGEAGGSPRRAVLAALTSLSRLHGEAVALVEAARFDPAFVGRTIADLEGTDLLLGFIVRGFLGACVVTNPASTPMFVPVVDVAAASAQGPIGGPAVPLATLGDAQVELVARQLGWSPRITRSDTKALRSAFAWARHEIRVLQATAREGIVPSRAAWPVVLVRPGAKSPESQRGGDA